MHTNLPSIQTYLEMHTGRMSTQHATPHVSDPNRQQAHERHACVACVWNEANALRLQHELPLKDFHISLTPGAGELQQHSLSCLRPGNPFELDERKLIQVRQNQFGQHGECLRSTFEGSSVASMLCEQQ